MRWNVIFSLRVLRFVQKKELFTLREQHTIVNMVGKLLPTSLPAYDLDLLQRAFDALHRTTGLQGRLVDIYGPGQHRRRADALVEITSEGKRHTYVAVLKRVDRFATLGIIKHQFEKYDKPGLLVNAYMTPDV